MNLNPFRRKAADPTRNQGGQLAVSVHQSQVLGPWTETFAGWLPRRTSPTLLESLREAVPVLDGGINRLVTLDGIVDVEGANAKLVDEIRDWMESVPVNDVECGFQAFYASMGDEHYEQGVGVGEFVYAANGRDVVGLRVADSKGIKFVRDADRLRIFYRAPGLRADTRTDGLGSVEALLRGGVTSSVTAGLLQLGYVELDPAQLVLAVHQPEADNPYGTSILRSVPFVAQILLKMQNATGRAWERFGDPPFHIGYKTKNRKIDSAEALRRATTIASNLATAMMGKARGNSVDLATGAGADDEVSIDVIGANGIALSIQEPGRHMLEQVVAAFGLPAWMLGITWSQASGIGEQQSVVTLQEAKTRFARREPGLRRPIEAMLRARGRTWKRGDWKLVQHLPNLQDEQRRAQAEFLRAQTALMQRDGGATGPVEPGTGIDNNLRSSSGPRRVKGRKATDDDTDGEPWAEEDPALPKLEASTIAALLGAWAVLRDDVLDLLGLRNPGGEPFVFDFEHLPGLLSRSEQAAATLARGLNAGQQAAWERGIANAGLELLADFDDPEVVAAIERLRAAARAHYAQEGLSLVRGGVARRYREGIVAQLAAGVYDGQNPVNVAAQLRQRFAAGEYNWERLARSEVAWAQSTGKRDLMQQQGVELYDYVTAGDARVSAICQSLAAGGPYRLDDPGAPLPMRDSHPNCRCTIASRA